MDDRLEAGERPMGCRAKARHRITIGILAWWLLFQVGGWSTGRAAVTREEVERAIREGVRFLKQEQRADGSWLDVHGDSRTGTTSLVTLALLTAGEPHDSPVVKSAVDYLRHSGPDQLGSTYAIALQTMVFAA